MSLIILDRDGHYIDVLKGGRNEYIIAHRHFDERHYPDSDDIDMDKQKIKFLIEVCERVLRTKLDYDKHKKKSELYRAKNSVPHMNGYIHIYLSSYKPIIFGMHYGSSWIGMGIPEAKVFIQKLKDIISQSKNEAKS